MKLCKKQIVIAIIVLGIMLFLGHFSRIILLSGLALWIVSCNRESILHYLSYLREPSQEKPIFHDYEEEKENNNELLR